MPQPFGKVHLTFMKKPLSGEQLQNNLVEKKAHIRHPRNTANTGAFGLPEAKNTIKHAYFQAGSVSAASSLKPEQQENNVNYTVFACCARNYPLPTPHPPANPNPKSGTPSTAAKSSKAKNNHLFLTGAQGRAGDWIPKVIPI